MGAGRAASACGVWGCCVAKGSSDVTPWAPRTCVRCGRTIRVSRDSWGCSWAGTGTAYEPAPTAWHLLDPACVPEKAA